MKRRWIIRGILLGLLSLFMIGCVFAWISSRPVPISSISKAEVTFTTMFFWDKNGKSGTNITVEVTDRQQLATLANFFPGMGRGKKSWTAAAWMAGASIKFFKTDGTVILINVSANDCRTWSEGQGDWDVRGDLKTYLTKLRTGPSEKP